VADETVHPTRELVATCPLDVWDGPYKMTCGRVLNRNGECLTHWAYSGDPPPILHDLYGSDLSDGNFRTVRDPNPRSVRALSEDYPTSTHQNLG
jgi:hypothetical protein